MQTLAARTIILMRSLLIILICLLYSVNSYSQNLYKGRLISSLTRKPIHSGYIELNGKLVASSDTSGYFTIELDSANNIALIIWSSEIGWVVVDNLHFKKNEAIVILLNPDCLYSFEKDIKENKLKLLITFGAFSKPLTEADHAFEKKYSLIYSGYGSDAGGVVTDCIETYNHSIGLYLDKKYGNRWRQEVNKNVTGL